MFKLKAPQSSNKPPSSWLGLTSLKTSPLFQIPEVYQYDPLPPGECIRYLVLEPAKDQEPLVCNLHAAPLTEIPYFEAISYVWGNSKKVAQVSCAGQNIRITANLRDALRRVRSLDSQRILWTDAICIDQKNRKEQGHQVALMGKIYGQANRTLICLGPDDGHGEYVASLVADINQMIDCQLEEFGSWDQLPSLDRKDPLAQDQRWSSFRALIHRPWFNRVWVVQEAALSTNACVLYGLTEIAWRDLLQVQIWLLWKARLVWFEFQLFLNDGHRPEFWVPINRMPPMHQHNFVEVLARTKPLRCSDARDRVYAFLGSPTAQVGPENGPVVEPDYDKSYLEVYLEVARQWLKHTRDLCLLSAVEHTAETFKSDFPSWVPRWDGFVVKDHFGLYGYGFDASKGTNQAAVNFTPSAGLRVRGLIVDSVHFRSKILPVEPPKPFAALWSHLSESTKSFFLTTWRYRSESTKAVFVVIWRYLSDPTTKFPYNDVEPLLAFARTLCAKKNDEDHPKFTADEASFGLWLCRKSSCFKGVHVAALEESARGGDIAAFMSDAMIWSPNRRFIITNNGYYGLAPQTTKEEDVCCIIYGMCVPIILRKTEKEHHYKLVGEAFIFGMMEGQALENIERWGLKKQDIILC